MENGVWYILAALIMGWTGFCIYKWIKNRKRGGCEISYIYIIGAFPAQLDSPGFFTNLCVSFWA